METYKKKAAELVAKMTLSEKASLTSGEDSWHTKAVDRLGISAIAMADGPNGLRKVVEGGGGASVPATCFPTSSALASTWNEDLTREVGTALGREAAANEVQLLLGPGVNIKRSPLGGRNFEYFSEDPFLAGKLAAAFITGVQRRNVGTSLKHYATNNQELERMGSSSNMDERTLYEIYLPAFETAIKAEPWTVMCAYNMLNGVYASEHPELLGEILRNQFGFTGSVVSDWGAVHDRVAGIKAGLNLEMPGNGGINDRRVIEAVEAGVLDEAVLDALVVETLAVILKAHAQKGSGATFDPKEHHALARKVGGEAIVLLKNDDAILPLDPKMSRIAIIGEFAKTPRYQGAGSAEVNPTRLSNAFDTLTCELEKKGTRVNFESGYRQDGRVDEELLTAAEESAATADIAIVFVGLPDSYESEGFDRSTMEMPEGHLRLIESVSHRNPKTVVVLMNGSAVTMPFAEHPGVKAIVEAWLGGQAGGDAVADILLGKVNPSGKLSETFPKRLEDTPCFLEFPGRGGKANYGEGIFVGYRYYDKKKVEPLFPFGYGLSYTTFTYNTLELSADRIIDVDGLTATVVVQNTGKTAGKEVVQLYVTDRTNRVVRPEKELKGFAKVALEPGEEKRVTFQLEYRDFAYYSEAAHDWCVATGDFAIRVGGSSVDLPLVHPLHITSTHPDTATLTRNSMVKQFENHPDGDVVYREVIETITAHFRAQQEAAHTEAEKLARERETRMQEAVVRDLPFYRLATLFSQLFDEASVNSLLEKAGISPEHREK